MTTEELTRTLEQSLILFRLPPNEIADRLDAVREEVLRRSRCLLVGNFTAIHDGDLRILFEAYDARFFDGVCSRILNSQQLRFRLSMRMTRVGGATTRFMTPAGRHYEIAIACGLLFDCFQTTD